jgi:predicted lipoprotein with Yx(FWY)xxD motif
MVATDSKLGAILVDGNGKTVYLFVADKGTASTCYTSCATVWPPVLTTGAPAAGTGATASLLGTTTRTDGKVEVTYAGHPLYYFIQDKKAGDTTGQGVNGFGGLWWVLSPAGAAITTK